MPGVRIYLQNIDHFYTMHSYTRILYLEEVGRRGAYLAPGLSEKTENFTFILTFLAKKCRKGGMVQALYAIQALAFFFWWIRIFLGGGLSCFVGNYSYIYVKLNNGRLCNYMLSFLYVCTCAMPRISYSTCWIIFPVWAPDIISGLISVVPWLSRREVIKKKYQVIFS